MGVYLGPSVYNESQVTGAWVHDEIAKNGKGVFFVDYHVTSYMDAKTAYDAGKVLIMRKTTTTEQGHDYVYYSLLAWYQDSDEGDQFRFGRANNNNKYENYYLHIRGGWSYVGESIVTIDNALNAMSNNAVTNAAITAVIGDIETLLQNL